MTLEDPVVLSVPGGDPNSAETLSYISGSAVVGALAGLWRKQQHAVDDTVFQSLFLNEAVRYLNAYPEGSAKSRLLPPPLSLRVEKDTQQPVYDLADPARDDILEDQDAVGLFRQFQPWTQGYIRLPGAALKYRMPLKTSRIHHQRDRDFGRALKNEGAIFSYMSLDAGERFIGKILLDDATHATALQDLFQSGYIQLGRSRCAQYGGRVHLELLPANEDTQFLEAGCSTFRKNDRLTITLLSDYLGVDPNGHITPEAFFFDLAEAFGFGENTEKLKILDRYVRVRPVSGYISVWAMPRPVVTAFQAGSVFVMQPEESIASDKISELLWKGLGDRRIEGFGRLAINWHGQEADNGPFTRTPEIDTITDLTVPVRTSPRQPGLFLLARKRLLEQALDRAVTNEYSDILRNPVNIPNRALLGRIRELLRTAANAQDILNFLENCRRPAEKQLERCRLDNHTLKEWLKRVFTDANDDISWLMQKFGMERAQSLSQVSLEYFREIQPDKHPDDTVLLWTYRKRLADMVLQGLARQSEEE